MTASRARRADRTAIPRIAFLAIATLMTLTSPGAAQNLTSASINGTVTDETGAGLPGVLVTLTSPALQEKQRTVVTDKDASYRFADLPIGLYALTYNLSGFQQLVREGLQLSAGFSARVNVTLKVGSLNETVTVSGQGPVIDLATTRGGRTVPTPLLVNELPAQKTVGDLTVITPGLTATVGQNAGVVGLNNRVRFSTYGLASGNTNVTVMIDGFGITANTIPDLANSLEADVKTFGNGAEVKEPGAAINIVTSSGGDTFHGRYNGALMHHSLQSTNLDDALRARRLRVGESLRYFYDASGDLGGRIVRDKLWFYGALHYRQSRRSVTGLVENAGPDGQYLTGDEPAAFPGAHMLQATQKVSYQPTPKYQLIGFYAKELTYDDIILNSIAGVVGTIIPPLEAINIFDWHVNNWKGELRGIPSNRLLFSVQAGRSDYTVYYKLRPGTEALPARLDRFTSLTTGSPGLQDSISNHWLANASVTYAPTERLWGRHELKFGISLKSADEKRNRYVPTGGAGDYVLIYDRVSGLLHQPVEIQVQNWPVFPVNRDNSYSGYVTDQWRIGSRLTLNLGLRFDRQHSWVPQQSKDAGRFSPAAQFPRVEVGSWNYPAPRTAMAWDLTGTGKTVLKATYGRFNPETLLSDTYNRNSTASTTYRWHDLNRNSDYDVGEVDLNTNGPDFLSITGASNIVLNSDLELPHIIEATASIEREVIPGMAVRGLYLYRSAANQLATINVLRPYSAYNIPITRTDPGKDGVLGTADDGGRFTIYDYDPAYRGSAFVRNQQVNSDRTDVNQAIEGAVIRNSSSGWSLSASYTAIKNRVWTAKVPQSPNDEYFPLDKSWRYNFKLSGNYTMRYAVSVGATLDVVNGPIGQRTNTFRATDASGLPLRQLSTVVLRVEPFGSQTSPAIPVWNLRVGKRFTVGNSPLRLTLDVLNVLNSNAVKATTFASGPSFRAVSDIVPPRNVRFGAAIEF